jgi:hypothetical protein
MKNLQKSIKTLAILALMLLLLSFTSCDFMLGMASGFASGMAGYGYGYGPSAGYIPSYGATAIPSYQQQSLQTQIQGTANFNQQMNQVMQDNMNAISNMPATTTAPIVVPQSTVSNSSSSSSNNSHQTKTPHTTYKDCHICHGSGVCSTCNGKGWYSNPYGTGTVTCTLCNKGKCRTCNGTGKVQGPAEWH